MRRRAPRGQHGISGTLKGDDPRLVFNAQGALRDDDLGPEFRRDANGRLRLREDALAEALRQRQPGAGGRERLGPTLYRGPQGVDLRPADAVDDLASGASLFEVIATVNRILQSDRNAGHRKG